ncbi:MAG: DNA repair protein RecO [Rhodocyclaceae bacterium]|jgi:DNA repair protein RecO (recombination protein O)|nr:DNA repair protein RecO [Rhodocyclaceae bacterium]MBK6906848.1 DNA repair protein RecO [Rhodocyclaceae bacterium]
MSQKLRVDGQTAFLLHSYPYSETSLIADVFSRDYGRLPLLARGARRPKSALRGLLIGFQPLELGWFGAGEVKTLAKAEWLGGIPLLAGRCLLLGYYLNELLISLLAREDAHPILFDSYVSALQALAHGAEDAPELRKFEVRLLRELGYGLRLETDAQTGSDIDATRRYLYQVERGPVPQVGAGDTAIDASVTGKTLLDMRADDYSDPVTRRESRRIMRQLISHHLGGRPLQSRRVYMELQGM